MADDDRTQKAAALKALLANKPNVRKRSALVLGKTPATQAAEVTNGRRLAKLSLVLHGLRKTAVNTLLKHDVRARGDQLLECSAKAAQVQADLQGVAASVYNPNEIQDDRYKGHVKRDLDVLIGQLSTKQPQDSATVIHSRSVAEWRQIYRALQDGSGLMKAVQLAERRFEHGVCLTGEPAMPAPTLTVGNFLDHVAGAGQDGLDNDALYVLTNVLPCGNTRKLQARRRKLQKEVLSSMSALQSLEPAGGLQFALVAIAGEGAPSFFRADGVHVTATESVFSQVRGARDTQRSLSPHRCANDGCRVLCSVGT